MSLEIEIILPMLLEERVKLVEAFESVKLDRLIFHFGGERTGGMILRVSQPH